MRELGTAVLALWRSRVVLSFVLCLWVVLMETDASWIDWSTDWWCHFSQEIWAQEGQASSPLTSNLSRYIRKEEGRLAWTPASAVPVPRLSLAPCAGAGGASHHGLGTLLYLTFPKLWLLYRRETPRHTEILPEKVNVRGCVLSRNSFWKIKISLQTAAVSRCCKACRMP